MDRPLTPRRLALLVLAAALAGPLLARVAAPQAGARVLRHAVALLQA
ncbi:hypothetical protein ACG04R_01475 [Roseateles sp. BYS78W]|uniref:Uncharacterized protein n=1 Tax=Pelomonas candidula TaxID=3299025 RepID=A0ABW7H6B2_9BURK